MAILDVRTFRYTDCKTCGTRLTATIRVTQTLRCCRVAALAGILKGEWSAGLRVDLREGVRQDEEHVC